MAALGKDLAPAAKLFAGSGRVAWGGEYLYPAVPGFLVGSNVKENDR